SGVVAVQAEAAKELAWRRALRLGAHHDHLGGRIALAQAAGKGVAIDGAQALLDDQQGGRLAVEERQAGARAVGGEHAVALALERGAQERKPLRSVAHQEDRGSARTRLPSYVHVPCAAPDTRGQGEPCTFRAAHGPTSGLCFRMPTLRATAPRPWQRVSADTVRHASLDKTHSAG